MKAQLMGKNQIRAFISPEEVKERGIDLETATYHDPNVAALINDVLLTLKNQVEESVFKLSHRTELIPVSDGSLILLITWAAEEREYLSEKGATFTPPPVIPGDPDSSGMPPYALPIDELQASVMADILSALSTGDLKEHLKKYLNEDFLEEILQAASASGLEEMLTSFLGDAAEDTGALISELTDPSASLVQNVTSKKKATKKKAKDCLCVTFKSISDAEKAVVASGLGSFKGESMLFKNENKYILVLSAGKMSVTSFYEALRTFQILYKGELKPLAYIAYLSEHTKTIIKRNAVGILSETV